MKIYGLAGKSLAHSFSKNYFEKKFSEQGLVDHVYLNFELEDIGQIRSLADQHPELRGLNVTIPYKTSVMDLLDETEEEAQKIGAVNCISIKDKHWKGYNTDAFGFEQSIKPFLDFNHQRALILGTGGASKAVSYVLRKKGIDVYHVSSDVSKKGGKILHYDDINENVMNAFLLIVNTTPLGTFPEEELAPALPYEHFTSLHLAYDLVYNPAQTKFLRLAAEKGAITENGLSMLKWQAEKAWEIWNR